MKVDVEAWVELDARSDLFSFGAVLYEMSTGSIPFRGEQCLTRFCTKRPPRAYRLDRKKPQSLSRLPDPLERRRSRHPDPEASQGGVREAVAAFDPTTSST